MARQSPKWAPASTDGSDLGKSFSGRRLSRLRRFFAPTTGRSDSLQARQLLHAKLTPSPSTAGAEDRAGRPAYDFVTRTQSTSITAFPSLMRSTVGWGRPLYGAVTRFTACGY